jgi:hypothetical protein
LIARQDFTVVALAIAVDTVILTWLKHRSHSSLRDLFSIGRAPKPTVPATGF